MKPITKAKIVLILLGILMIYLGFDLWEIIVLNRRTIVVGIIGIILVVGSLIWKAE